MGSPQKGASRVVKEPLFSVKSEPCGVALRCRRFFSRAALRVRFESLSAASWGFGAAEGRWRADRAEWRQRGCVLTGGAACGREHERRAAARRAVGERERRRKQ